MKRVFWLCRRVKPGDVHGSHRRYRNRCDYHSPSHRRRCRLLRMATSGQKVTVSLHFSVYIFGYDYLYFYQRNLYFICTINKVECLYICL